MTHSRKASKINNKPVRGEGHLQPGGNPWIGVFDVDKDLLRGDPLSWRSAIINYEGPFDCRSEHINGRGKARILYIKYDKKKDKVTLNVEGIGDPKLEKRLKKAICFSYNSNLPLD